MSQNNKVKKFEKLSNKLLLENEEIIDKSENINYTGHIIIEQGKITNVQRNKVATFNGEKIDCQNAVVMPGFFDMHVHLREPGREDEETVITGSNAAANGGFTGIACMPNTKPLCRKLCRNPSDGT